MKMIAGLLIGAFLGLGGTAITAIAGILSSDLSHLRTHLLWALAGTFWNLFIQSMILFMWIGMARQIQKHLRSRASFPGELGACVRRLRNRILPWILGTFPVLTLPLFTGMLHAAYGKTFKWWSSARFHSITAWAAFIYLGVTVALEFRRGFELFRIIHTLQDRPDAFNA